MDIEEDINILNEYINIDRKMRNNNQESDYDKFCERQCIAIENLLAEREEDKKKIAELEAKLEFYQWGDLDNLKFEEYMKEFIPKQKVKDLKESIVLEPTIVGGRRNAKTLEYGIKLGKKLEDLKKHNKELDDKKLNLEEELKKII